MGVKKLEKYWFVVENGQTLGPFSLHELQRLLDGKKIDPLSKVYEQGGVYRADEAMIVLDLIKSGHDATVILFDALKASGGQKVKALNVKEKSAQSLENNTTSAIENYTYDLWHFYMSHQRALSILIMLILGGISAIILKLKFFPTDKSALDLKAQFADLGLNPKAGPTPSSLGEIKPLVAPVPGPQPKTQPSVIIENSGNKEDPNSEDLDFHNGHEEPGRQIDGDFTDPDQPAPEAPVSE